MTRRRALVTGGCGFVGRHFARRLLDDGYAVTIVDDLSTGVTPDRWPDHLRPSAGLASALTVHHADFRDYARDTVPAFDLILHLAAVVGGRMTIEGDPLRVATDLAIDAVFFNWLARHHSAVRKVLYFSSSAAYPVSAQGRRESRALAEEEIDFEAALGVPDLTYGWSKLTGEFLARHAARTYGIDVCIYRPFSGYGEDQDFTYPFPSIVRRVGRRESPLVVWGSGEQRRDFIYIGDVVDAVLVSAPELKPGEALNLGTGDGVSFRWLAETACRVLGHDAPVVNDASKPEGVFSRVADCRRLFRHYRPVTSLERGIEIVHLYQRRAGLLDTGP
ncbi:MAG TPA: NAD-dependent epimerase/dehydratase family protein [Verrucomicrobiae bacterium]|nr:NAD-dependent epimerase/dehydratase family protein [Verrucomicrobiae bacterium]